MSESGWIKLHRKLLESNVWTNSTPVQKAILIALLLKANHKPAKWDYGGNEFELEPGEFITSLKSICDVAGIGVSTQNVRTAIKRFEKLNFLTNQSTNQYRRIKIINWDTYQSKDDLPNKQANTHLTSNQQATNKQLTTNKNNKNNKNEKNDKKTTLVLPDWLDLEIWKEFKKYRRNGKGAFTEYAQKLAITKLGKLRDDGNDPNEVLQQSIECGWSGLFPLRKNNSKEETREEWIARQAARLS